MKGVTVQQALDAWRRKCEEEKKDAIGRPQVVRTKKKKNPVQNERKTAEEREESGSGDARRGETREIEKGTGPLVLDERGGHSRCS